MFPRLEAWEFVVSKFGRQPAADALRRERYTVTLAAQVMGVPENNLRCAVTGYNRPKPEVLDGLVKLLGLPAEKLFTAEVLAKPYAPYRNAWKPVAK